jgi:hypothetical protein
VADRRFQVDRTVDGEREAPPFIRPPRSGDIALSVKTRTNWRFSPSDRERKEGATLRENQVGHRSSARRVIMRERI